MKLFEDQQVTALCYYGKWINGYGEGECRGGPLPARLLRVIGILSERGFRRVK